MPSLVEIGPVVLEKKILLNFVSTFSLHVFRNYLSLEKGVVLHLTKFKFPLPKDVLYQVWLKLAQWFWKRRFQCEKFTDRRTTGNQKSLLELSTQVS